jgi:hypothetical protein
VAQRPTDKPTESVATQSTSETGQSTTTTERTATNAEEHDIIEPRTVTANESSADALKREKQITPAVPRIRLVQFVTDDTLSPYRLYRYDPAKPIRPEGKLTFYPDGSLGIYGQKFQEVDDLLAFERRVREKTNHHFFGWLPSVGLTPTDVPLVIEPEVPIIRDQKQESVASHGLSDWKYPAFRLTIVNDSKVQVVLTEVRVTISKVVPVLAAGQTGPLAPLATYSITIVSQEGIYSQDLIPPFKIAADDSATVALRVLPRFDSREPVIGKVLIGSISLVADSTSLTTDQFMLYFEDPGES